MDIVNGKCKCKFILVVCVIWVIWGRGNNIIVECYLYIWNMKLFM